MDGIVYEYAAGTSVTIPSRVPAMDSVTGKASAIDFEVEIEAEIGRYTYGATIYQGGSIDLRQPSVGSAHRQKKTLHITSTAQLISFLGMVEAQAREYYGPDWGKE
jgi:hypothetical protein